MCGLVGYIGKRVDKEMVKDLLIANVSRGRDATGVLAISREDPFVPRIAKRAIPSTQFVHEVNLDLMLEGVNLVIGHVRHATSGPKTEEAAHPFEVNNPHWGKLYGAHNGTLSPSWVVDARKLGLESKCIVDSQFLLHKLLMGGVRSWQAHKTKGSSFTGRTEPPHTIVKPLRALEGSAACLFNRWMPNEQSKIAFEKYGLHLGVARFDRPLFFLQDLENDGIWFSSTATELALYAKRKGLKSAPIEFPNKKVVDYYLQADGRLAVTNGGEFLLRTPQVYVGQARPDNHDARLAPVNPNPQPSPTGRTPFIGSGVITAIAVQDWGKSQFMGTIQHDVIPQEYRAGIPVYLKERNFTQGSLWWNLKVGSKVSYLFNPDDWSIKIDQVTWKPEAEAAKPVESPDVPDFDAFLKTLGKLGAIVEENKRLRSAVEQALSWMATTENLVSKNVISLKDEESFHRTLSTLKSSLNLQQDASQ